MDTSRTNNGFRSYLTVIALAVSAFMYGTSELMPIGLMSDIAVGLGVSESQAGMVITVYAWCVAVCSLPLMLLCAKINHRKLVLWLLVIFSIGHFLCWIAPNYYSLIAARVVVALSHSVFWSVLPAMAVAIFPGNDSAKAISIIAAGESIAVVAGMPIGRTIGLLAGWRMSFGTIAIVSALLFLYFLKEFPGDHAKVSADSRKEMLRATFTSRPLLLIYLVTAIFVTGHFSAYSYIEPYLLQIGNISNTQITLILCLFGLAGLIASTLMSRHFSLYQRGLLKAMFIGIPAAMIALSLCVGLGFWIILPICILWGMCITCFNIASQDEVMRFSPTEPSVPMSVVSSFYNVGIGAGALVGGSVITSLKIDYVCMGGALIALLAAVICFIKLLPLIKIEK